jgi:cytoskeletal protein CcmA (bactofilin family)
MFWKRRTPITEALVVSKGFALAEDRSLQASPLNARPETRRPEQGIGADVLAEGSPTQVAVAKGSVFVVPTGYRISGAVVVRGTLRIDGELTGKGLFASKMIVSPGGRVQASVEAAEAIVEGALAGPLRVRQQVEIRATARVSADIEALRCVIQPGAMIADSALSVGPRR